MRETYSSLIQSVKDYISDPTTQVVNQGISDTDSFIKKELNKSYREIQAQIKNHLTQRVQTTVTVSGQQFYALPVDCHLIDSITVTISGRKFPIYPVEIDKWLEANRLVFSATAIPTYYLRREKDFGIWPIPQADGQVITLWYDRISKDMTAIDYTTGNVSVTNASATVTGLGTAWTSDMVGRYFEVLSDGGWYRIASVQSATELTLENVYQGVTTTGASYIIGDSPEIPEQLHEFLPYKVAATYYAGPRRDPIQAQSMMNYYYTGDFNNSSRNPQDVRNGVIYWINWYNGKGRSDNGIVDRSKLNTIFFNDQWSTVTT